jgi:hypothetical protein
MRHSWLGSILVAGSMPACHNDDFIEAFQRATDSASDSTGPWTGVSTGFTSFDTDSPSATHESGETTTGTTAASNTDETTAEETTSSRETTSDDTTPAEPTTSDETTTGGDECEPHANDDDCDACLEDECCSQYQACLAQPACTCWASCVFHGGNGLPCQAQCGGPAPELFDNLISCGQPSCAMDCSL